MKNIRKIAAIAACTMLMGGCGAKSSTTVMTIGDEKITDNEVVFFVNEFLNSGSSFDSVKEQAVEMIESAVLTEEVALAWGLELTDEEEENVKASIRSIRQQFGGKSAFDASLKEYGVDEEFVATLLKESLYANKINSAIAVDGATDEEMQEYFKNNYLRAKHVLITTKNMATGEELDKDAALATANDVLAKAQAGEDFDALVAEYNEDPGMDSNSDGYVFTANEMVAPFEETTRSLNPGEIAMCETDYGYHVILRLALDETPEKFSELYEANKAAVSTALKESKQDAALLEKADEYGIAVVTDDEAIANLKNTAAEDAKNATE